MFKKYEEQVKRIAQDMIDMGCFEEACMFACFLENNDSDTVHALSVKYHRIFTASEVKKLAKAVRFITNKYVPSYIFDETAQNALEDEVNSKDNKVITLFHNRARN